MARPFDNNEPLSWNISPLDHAGRYSARTSTILPVTAEELFFVGEGGRYGGVFDVSMSEEQGTQDIAVDIHAEYRHENAIHDVEIRLMRPAIGKEGVGIVVSFSSYD